MNAAFEGLFNAVVGLTLLAMSPVVIGFNPGFCSMLVGSAAQGSYLALHFGKIRNLTP